jgi:nuclear protein localization protein 4 homolog
VHRQYVLESDLLTRPQEEEALLCRVAVDHDVGDAMQLAQTDGWKTLMTILDNYGERPLKRPWLSAEDTAPERSRSPSEQLAKRFKQAKIAS